MELIEEKKYNNINYITSDKIHFVTDLTICFPDNIYKAPWIALKNNQYIDINNINFNFDNPRYIYVYPACYKIFTEKINFFNNPFVLVSNNSDYPVVDNTECSYIANHPKVIKWFAQNLLWKHPKIAFIPLGFANPQWLHGNPEAILNTIKNLDNIKKINDIYFHFTISNNFAKRNDCYQKLRGHVRVSEIKMECDYFAYLATFKFALCPEGNGVDTYRLWECFYFKVIPIVLDNMLMRFIKEKYNFPMIILNDWNDLIGMQLTYEDYDNSKLDVNIIKEEILNSYKTELNDNKTELNDNTIKDDLLNELQSFSAGSCNNELHKHLWVKDDSLFIPQLNKLLTHTDFKLNIINIEEFYNEDCITLGNIFSLNNSDKASVNNYHIIYYYILNNLGINSKLNILEIGIGTNNPILVSTMGPYGTPGASLITFRNYLPNSMIYGADNDKNILFTSDRIKTFYVDQLDINTFNNIDDIKFDLIIDDGLHSIGANFNTLLYALEHLKDNGWIVIEDIQKSHIDNWKTIDFIFKSMDKYKTYIIQTKAAYIYVISKKLNIKKYNDKDYEILFDKRFNKYATPFHNDLFMMRIILTCLEKAEYFIETGLFLGYTSYFVAKNFPNIKCYSCENNIDFLNLATINIGTLDNLKIELICSPYGLHNLNTTYDDSIFDKYNIFWIDAHFYKYCPLNEEIDYITQKFKKFTMFIDDFCIPYDNKFRNDGDGFTIESIKPYINNKEKLKIYMPCYDSNHPDCNNIHDESEPPIGYCIITTETIETYDYLREIHI